MWNFHSKVGVAYQGNSSAAKDPLLSEALKPTTELESRKRRTALQLGQAYGRALPTEDVEENRAKFDMQTMLVVDDEIPLTVSGSLSEDETGAS